MLNGVFVINKGEGITSHDVVSAVRRILKTRHVGHGGTLDPMATGVLPVFVGRATRASNLCIEGDKEYVAKIRFGLITDTQDVTGNVIKESEEYPSYDKFLKVINGFIGKIAQIPPMYSAIKKDGVPLYKLARQGVEIERCEREVEVYGIDVLSFDGNEHTATFKVRCSKGLYVRTLCHDIGERLGCGACMASLSRTKAGKFDSEHSVTLEELEAYAKDSREGEIMIPVEELFCDLNRVYLSDRGTKLCRNGNSIPIIPQLRLCDGEQVSVYGKDFGFMMVGEVDKKQRVIKTVKSFFEV